MRNRSKSRTFGPIHGVEFGAVFKDRAALGRAGVHPPTVAGLGEWGGGRSARRQAPRRISTARMVLTAGARFRGGMAALAPGEGLLDQVAG